MASAAVRAWASMSVNRPPFGVARGRRLGQVGAENRVLRPLKAPPLFNRLVGDAGVVRGELLDAVNPLGLGLQRRPRLGHGGEPVRLVGAGGGLGQFDHVAFGGRLRHGGTLGVDGRLPAGVGAGSGVGRLHQRGDGLVEALHAVDQLAVNGFGRGEHPARADGGQLRFGQVAALADGRVEGLLALFHQRLKMVPLVLGERVTERGARPLERAGAEHHRLHPQLLGGLRFVGQGEEGSDGTDPRRFAVRVDGFGLARHPVGGGRAQVAHEREHRLFRVGRLHLRGEVVGAAHRAAGRVDGE
jgi:hypothetical protein